MSRNLYFTKAKKDLLLLLSEKKHWIVKKGKLWSVGKGNNPKNLRANKGLRAETNIENEDKHQHMWVKFSKS